MRVASADASSFCPRTAFDALFFAAALFFALAALLLAATMGAAPAQADACHDPASIVRHIFEQADTDADGVLSQTEYASAGLEGYGVSFEQSDLDDDGGTSFDEYLELYQRHHPSQDPSHDPPRDELTV